MLGQAKGILSISVRLVFEFGCGRARQSPHLLPLPRKLLSSPRDFILGCGKSFHPQHGSPIHGLQSDTSSIGVIPFATRVTEIPNDDVAEVRQRTPALGGFEPGKAVYRSNLAVRIV